MSATPLVDRWLDDEVDDGFSTDAPAELGGAGSGFRGHKGRPGEIGGSAPDGIDVNNPSDSPIPSLVPDNFLARMVEAATTSVIEHGLATGKERTILVSAKGNLFWSKDGTESEVSGIPLAGLRQSYALVHNHPNSISFSEDDMNCFFEYPTERLMIAIGHNGDLYTLQKPDGWDYRPDWRAVYERRHNESALQFEKLKADGVPTWEATRTAVGKRNEDIFKDLGLTYHQYVYGVDYGR